MTQASLWKAYCDSLIVCDDLGLSVDVSRVRFAEGFRARMAEPLGRALQAMEALEAGAVANPDENRRVGHYWLRDPGRAPEPALGEAVRSAVERVRAFAAAVHRGEVAPERGGAFEHLLVVGIGGS